MTAQGARASLTARRTEISAEDKGVSRLDRRNNNTFTALTPNFEQPERLRQGTIQVRKILGPHIQVTDEEIEESLWHYYYDVDKSIHYLLCPQRFRSIGGYSS